MKKKDNTKEAKILDATAAIILSEGASAVSTTKVAKKVGIAQSNIYIYFKDKDDLLKSVLKREQQKITIAGGTQLLQDEQAPTVERLNAWIHSLYEFALKNPDSLLLIEQIKFLQGRIQDEQYDLFKMSDLVSNLIERGIQEGILRPLHPSFHMTIVFMTIRCHTQNLAHQIYPSDQYAFSAIRELIWDAITINGTCSSSSEQLNS